MEEQEIIEKQLKDIEGQIQETVISKYERLAGDKLKEDNKGKTAERIMAEFANEISHELITKCINIMTTEQITQLIKD